MEYQQIAKALITHVGGSQNIKSVMHCATRLRFVLHDSRAVDEEALSTMDIVKGTFYTNGQYQIIIGAGTVNLVCDAVSKILGFHSDQSETTTHEKEGNILSRAVKLLSDIFVPIIPAIVAGGLLMGLYNILTATFFDGQSLITMYPQIDGLAKMINTFANAPFVFLPVLLGFSATKKFGGNPYLGAVMGMIMVHPDLLNAYALGTGVDIPNWNIFGFSIASVGYQGTVLPVLVVSWILANIETRLHKVTPSWLDNLSTPLISILFTAILTFTIVGPLMRSAGDVMAQGITWIYTSLGFLGGAIFGGFYAPIVITGMHHSFIAIETQLLADIAVTGGSFIFVTASMSNVAQGAAVLAVLLTTKNEKMKSLCSASGIAALLGITEPAMFGVNLKLRYPFIAACVGSAVGSAWIAFHHILANALGAAGLPGFISVNPNDWLNFAIGLILAISISFGLTYYLAKRTKFKDMNQITIDENNSFQQLQAIMKGSILPLEQASDEMFASKAMGDGIVIQPHDGLVYAPCDADILFVFPSKHAIGLRLADGTELLIHCGINTVELNGKGFESYVKEQDHVITGALLLKMDIAYIQQQNYSCETMLVITKLPDQKEMMILAEGNVDQGQAVLQIGS